MPSVEGGEGSGVGTVPTPSKYFWVTGYGEIKDPNLTTFCMTLGNRFNHSEYQFYHKIKTIIILSRVFLSIRICSVLLLHRSMKSCMRFHLTKMVLNPMCPV